MACVSTTLRCLLVLLLRVLRLAVVGVLNHSFSLSVYGNISHIYSTFWCKTQVQNLYSTHAKNCVQIFWISETPRCGYSVGYSPSVLRIMRRASSMRVSHSSVLPVTLAPMALLCTCFDCSYSGASDLFSIMFCQCMMSSMQVPLPCEWPACAGSVSTHNSRIDNSMDISFISIFICLTPQLGIGCVGHLPKIGLCVTLGYFS